MSRTHLSSDLNASFALYGALHASVLVLTLRARPPIWRKSLFVVIAAGLCLITFRMGLFARHLSATLPGNLGLYTPLGFAAATGALIYGISIRLLGIPALTLGSLAAISLGCMLATFVALFTGSHFHFLAPWWLAVLWWHAFSGGLWYVDDPPFRDWRASGHAQAALPDPGTERASAAATGPRPTPSKATAPSTRVHRPKP
jgi:hypothetical protein